MRMYRFAPMVGERCRLPERCAWPVSRRRASVGSSLNKLGITELTFHTAELAADIAGPDAMLDGRGSARILGAPGGRIACAGRARASSVR